MGTTFQARDLWATQVPYVESDKIPIIVGYLTRMLFVGKLKANFALYADATIVEA